MQRCSACQAKNEDAAKFCNTCGSALSAPSAAKDTKNFVYFGDLRIPMWLFLILLLCAACATLPFLLLFGSSNSESSSPIFSFARTPTPEIFDQSLTEIQHCCTEMTTAQRDQYLTTLVGKRVHWQAKILDVYSDGKVTLDIDGTYVEMLGTPARASGAWQKGQAIDFVATITKANQAFLIPGVQLRFVELR